MPMGKRFNTQTKEVFVHVYDYFKELNNCKCTQEPFLSTADAFYFYLLIRLMCVDTSTHTHTHIYILYTHIHTFIIVSNLVT